MASGADLIIVGTWNEFFENTGIEPSNIYGNRELQTTQLASKQWRSGHSVVQSALASAADYRKDGISPGELVVLFGQDIGPPSLQTATLDNGHLPTNIGGFQILVNSAPAPLLYISKTQIAFFVPFSLDQNKNAVIGIEREAIRCFRPFRCPYPGGARNIYSRFFWAVDWQPR